MWKGLNAYSMWGPPLSFVQHHEDSVFRQRLEEFLCVHTCAVFIQHQGAHTWDIQRVTNLGHKETE